MSKKEISYEAMLSAQQVVGLLEDLAGSLKDGAVCLQVGEEHLLLHGGGDAAMELQVSAAEKKDKNRLSLQLTWKTLECQSQDSPQIVISSKAPAGEQRSAPKKAAPKPAAPKPKKPGTAKAKGKAKP